MNKFDVQLAVGATQAGGTQEARSPEVLAQHHLAFMVSAVPAVGSLAVYGRTIGAKDFSLITTVDMTAGAQLIPFMGIFDKFRAVPTGFDAGKKYWLTVTTSESGMFGPSVPKLVTRNTIGSGLTASTNLSMKGHMLIPQHQLQLDCVGTAAGSVTVFAKPLNGGLVPLGTIAMASGPRHILFRGFFDEIQLVPTGLAGAKVNATLVSVEDGLVGPSLEMLMPMSTGQFLDGQAAVYSAAAGRFVPRKTLRRGALYILNVTAVVPTSVMTAANPLTWALAGQQYDTDGIWAAGNPTRFTVPKGCTAVQLGGNCEWAASAVGARRLRVQKNGADFNGQGDDHSATQSVNGNIRQNLYCGPVDVVAGDYFELDVTQNTGGNLNVNSGTNTWFLMRLTDAA